eukprot:scaffold203472_cov13-Tisochrysis_lutea.AAC.1
MGQNIGAPSPWPQHMPQQLLAPIIPPPHGSLQPSMPPSQINPQHQQQQQLGSGTFQQSSVLMWEVMNLVMMRSVLTSALGAMHNQMAGMANQLVVQAVSPAVNLANGLGGMGLGGLGPQANGLGGMGVGGWSPQAMMPGAGLDAPSTGGGGLGVQQGGSNTAA